MDHNELNTSNKPRMLLHICCAPCAAYVVRVLRERFVVAGYFYNPNIQPEEEYALRKEEMERYALEIALPLHIGEYDVKRWFDLIKGYEEEPEGGARCAICYRMRLERTAQYASAHRFEYVTTTLSISPHKKAAVINRIGEELAQTYDVKFYGADFKKKNGFKISSQISRELGLYRQNYCGCVFSKRER